MPDTAIRLAIVGAESTGKTTLAAALAPRLAKDCGLRVTWVPEVLRDWCQHMGRTPRQEGMRRPRRLCQDASPAQGLFQIQRVGRRLPVQRPELDEVAAALFR